MSNEADILLAAKNAILDGWCQRVSARDANGYEVTIDSGLAVEVCSHGAILAAQRSLNVHDWQNSATVGSLLDECLPVECDSFIDWNDAEGRTKQEVVDLFDAAIFMAKEADN